MDTLLGLLVLGAIWSALASILVGYVGHVKGRDFFNWLVLGFLFTPILAAICLVALPARAKS